MTSIAARVLLTDFALANPLYANALVRVLTVDTATWLPTDTLATIYSSTAGSAELTNPARLDGEGKWGQPVYVSDAVLCRVTDAQVPSHDTGITGIGPFYFSELVTEAAAGDGDALPATPAGYVEIYVGGTAYLSPLYPKP